MAAKKSKTKSTKKTLARPPAKPKKRPAPPRSKPTAKAKTRPTAKTKPTAKAKPATKAKPSAASPRESHRPPHIPPGPTELDTIKLAYLFRDTSPTDIYRAFMDPFEHATFTGDAAEIDARVGGAFRSYSGFIVGTTLELIPGARIVQSWRTKHFPRNNPDSTLELTFTPVAEGTRLEMRHLDVPKDQVEYLVTGWVKHYLDPLARHLGKRASMRPPPL